MANSFKREEGDKPLGSRLDRTILSPIRSPQQKEVAPATGYGMMITVFCQTSHPCVSFGKEALNLPLSAVPSCASPRYRTSAAPGKRRKDAGAGHRAVTFFYSTCLALLNRER